MRGKKRSLRQGALHRRLAISSRVILQLSLRALARVLRRADRRDIADPPAMSAARLASEQALFDQRQAETEKQRQLTAESKAKTWGTHVDTLRKLVPMVALAYGLAVSFLYFFLAIHFFPSGLSVGDTLLYVFIALGYGLVSMLFAVLGTTAQLPSEAYAAGRRAVAQPLSVQRSGFQWVVVTIFAPALLAWLLWLDAQAFESWVEDHIYGLILGLIVVSTALGLAVNARAWQEGSGLDRTRTSRARGDWLWPALGHGFAFIAVYSLVLLLYGMKALPPLCVAVYAGFFAWLALNLLGASKAGKDASADRLEALRPRSGAVVAVLGLLIAASPLLFYQPHPLRAVITAALGAVIYVVGVGFLPLCQVKELQGPPRPQTSGKEADDTDTVKRREAGRRLTIAIVAIVSLSVPLFADIVFLDFSISTAVFRGLGLRVDNASVRLKGESLSAVRAHARNAGVALSVCIEPDGSAIVAPVSVLWHGMGKRSLLAFGQPHGREIEKPREGMLQVEVNSDDLKLLQNQGTHCRDMKQAVFFRSGKAQAALAAQERALASEIDDVFLHVYPAPDEKHASNWRWSLERVLVSGYADPMPLGEAGNEGLARQRAACVAGQVLKAMAKRGRHPFEDPDVRWDGEGARSVSKANCPLEGNHPALVECHAANRFAHVRMIFSCKDAQGKPFNGCEMGVSGPEDKFKPVPVLSEQAALHLQSMATDAALECANPSLAVDRTAGARQP